MYSRWDSVPDTTADKSSCDVGGIYMLLTDGAHRGAARRRSKFSQILCVVDWLPPYRGLQSSGFEELLTMNLLSVGVTISISFHNGAHC